MRLSLYLATSMSALAAHKYAAEAVRIQSSVTQVDPQLSAPFFE